MATTVKVDWDTKQIRANVKDAAIDILKNAGEFILDESNKIAPIDEGTLINSGGVSVDENDLTVNIFYDTPYAVRQHEDMALKHTNGRSAKFLERAARENADRIAKYISDQLRKVIE